MSGQTTENTDTETRSAARDHFGLDWTHTHLNHGSFGAVPLPVSKAQDELRAQIEANPHRFFTEQYDSLLADNRGLLAADLRCDPAGLAFVRNATEGIVAAALSVRLAAGDEVLTTNHEYASLLAMWERLCAQAGAHLRVVDLGLGRDHAWADDLLNQVSARTRVVFVSHVTSSTALVLPLAPILHALAGTEVMTIVDAAHVPGHLHVDLAALGADVYVGNLHKWAMHPRGAGFLYASERVRAALSPELHSWYYTAPEFTRRFSWLGTVDPAPWLVTGAVRDFHAMARADGWTDHARMLSREAETRLRQMPGLTPLPAGTSRAPYFFAVHCEDWTEAALKHHLQSAGLWPWIGTWGGRTLLRVSTSYYNQRGDVDRLIHALHHRPAGPR